MEIRSNNTLRVDGSRFFPIGLVELGNDRYADWNDRIRRSGANVVWDNGMAYADSVPSCEAIRDSADAAGYLVLAGSPDTWAWDLPATPEQEIAEPMYAPDSLGSLVSCFDARDNLLGFANRDEPVWAQSQGLLGDIDSLHVLETYDQLRAESPWRVVATNFAPVHQSEDAAIWQSDIEGYLDATDVVMFANYPYPAGPGTCQSINVLGYPECAMDRLPIGMSLMRDDICRSDQPLWAIVQAFKGIPLKEMRWEAYSAIIHGATGVFWAGWSWVHPLGDGADNWPVTEQVVSEVSSLHSTLARYRRNREDVASLHPDVDLLELQQSGGAAVILTAARNGYQGPATIDVGTLNADWAEVLFENRWIPIVNDRFTDYFDGYEAHVYRVDEDFNGNPPDPTAIVDPDGRPAGPFRIRVAPNPATGVARARYELARAGAVDFAVYDLAGRMVGRADARPESDTGGSVVWNGRGADGAVAPAGVYFLRGTAEDGTKATARIVWR
ncbi:T9SS type A sorting domain-containing protein [bacterium]|nr:T9SS type A sorting domain-containing protein [bacterium]